MGVNSNIKLMEMVPFGAMITLEFLDVGLTTLSKAAMSKGMSHYVFVVYSNGLGTLFLFLASFLLQRRTKTPPITFPLLCRFFLLGLFAITMMQNCLFTGISYSSPALASSMGQLIPAFTFLLAVIFRMEKLDLRSSRSQFKILGTIVSVSGALIVILYKGRTVLAKNFESEPTPSNMLTTPDSWVIGGLFLATGSLSVAISNIFQAAILQEFKSEMTVVSFFCLFGTIQSTILSFIAERDNPNAWKLRPDIELISVFYAAVCGNLATYGVIAWCIQKKGPVFVAMFKPLGIVIAAFMGVIFLGDTLYIGSIVGAIIAVAGFYAVIWAQSKEGKGQANQVDRQESSSQKAPLLERHM